MSHPEELYRQLGIDPALDSPRVVLHQDGTAAEDGNRRESGLPAFAEDDVDALFSNTKSHVIIKREKPEHRMILWHRLKGMRPKEIAVVMRCTYQTVLNVCGQTWFKEAFVRLSTEMGADAAEAFLRGEEIPALQRLVDLAENAESENTRLAANNSLLDRIRGKPVVKQEIKSTSTSTIDVAVADVAALQAEAHKLSRILFPNGNPTASMN